MSIGTVLITGGAGFIGQHSCRSFLERGYKVRILDNFQPQIHGINDQLPTELAGAVELFRGDVRDRELMAKALRGADAVVHLAAETGTGQSMYEIERYFSVNVQGTAVLIDLLQNASDAPAIRSIVVASSRAIYGEGAYLCSIHDKVYPDQRLHTDMEQGHFEPRCPTCGAAVTAVPTDEATPLKPMSIYGLTKQIQEQAVLMIARNHGMNGVALRYQNVYGPGQSLRNPYTGILAVFSNLARSRQTIEVYEDGQESRDFVYIDDVVRATVSAVALEAQYCGALNIGSGVATTVQHVASEINAYFGGKSAIQVTGAFRAGDIRHNVAALHQAERQLRYKPTVAFAAGIRRFLQWAEGQEAGDRSAYAASVAELAAKGLMGHQER